MQMDRPYYRDDLMIDLGFYPSDLSPYPLTIRITQVSGKGYDVGDICPPGCDEGACESNTDEAVETVANANDLFVTLTVVDELADTSQKKVNGGYRHFVGLLVWGVVTFIGF